MKISKIILISLLSIILSTTDYHGFLYSNDGILSGDFSFDEKKIPLNTTKYQSYQMRHPESLNDMLIKKININLKIEYEKFVHIKITDSNNKNRWEVPNDIISKEYQYNLHKNINDKMTSPIYNFFFTNESDIFSFELKDNDNNTFYTFSNNTFLYTDRFINFESILTTDYIFGFGERYHNIKLDKGVYTIWPNDTGGITEDDGKGGKNGYSHQPVAIHKTSSENIWLGFVFLNSNNQDVVIKDYNQDLISLQHKTIGGIIDYYIIVDSSPEEVIKDIQKLLGNPFLPPYWAIGSHQSRYGFNNFTHFKETYENYYKNNISLDTMWVDIDSMNNYQIFTVNENNFKELPDFIQKIQTEDHSHFIPIIDIGVGDNNNDKFSVLGKKLDCFIKSNYTKKNLIINVWPGDTLIPDFLNPNTTFFWQYGLKTYRDIIHYDGIWFDMNEVAALDRNPKCIGEEAEICDKKDNFYFYDDLPYLPGYDGIYRTNMAAGSINENGLLYGNDERKYAIYNTKPILSYMQIKMTYNFLKNNEKVRPFIISRSCTFGTGKYCGHWLGDNHVSYGDMKNSLNGIFHFDIFGQPTTGDDICGFFGNTNKILCNRWYNLGVFYAFSRNHNAIDNINQYPWSFNDDTILNNIRNAVNYRYSLLRYIYSHLFATSLNEKVGFFNPVFFYYPNDDESYNDIDQKAMVGDAFILIPIFYEDSSKTQAIKLPQGKWNYYPSGKVLKNIDEDRKVELSGALDIIHLYMRGGVIVPWQNTFEKYIQNSYYLRKENLNLIINLNEDKKAKGVLFFDNDGINTIENKEYIRIDLNYENNVMSVNTTVKDGFKYDYNDNFIGKIELWGESNKQDCNITINTMYLEILQLGPIPMEKDEYNDKFYVDLSENNLELDKILNFEFIFGE